jgi:predicted RNA-binding Zn-ribbon protein involved in translation (DUF1610 family)
MTAAAETALTVVHEPPSELTIEQIVQQAQKIQQAIKLVMKEGEHFGVIPGTGQRDGKPPKPTLLKPGAEKLCLLFRLDPQYDIVDKVETSHLIRLMIRCTVYHIPTGLRVASGLGSCNSSEEKYLRAAPKKCPKCGKESIIRGKEEFGGGFLCWKKKDGCGAKFDDVDVAITGQDTGIKDPADLHNTILKMACKRALIAAVLNATAASDFFTQDLEDLTEKAAEYIPPKKDDLKEKLEASVAATAPKAPASTPASDADSGSPANDPSPPDAPAADTGEAATADQKDALRIHIRKRGWKMGYTRQWFHGLYGFNANAGDPLEQLTQKQADAAFTLLLAHGTPNYRVLRLEMAANGIVKADQDDLKW